MTLGGRYRCIVQYIHNHKICLISFNVQDIVLSSNLHIHTWLTRSSNRCAIAKTSASMLLPESIVILKGSVP